MKLVKFFLFCIFFIFSAVIGKAEEYYDPIILNNSDYILIPIGAQQDEKGFLGSMKSGYYSSGASYSEYTSIYAGNKYVKLKNIIVYNKKTGIPYPLFGGKVLISALFYPDWKEEQKKELPLFLLFGVHDDDTNGNNQIDTDDAQVVYISDLNGKNLKKVTPDNTFLESWQLDEDQGDIYIRIRTDANKDRKFDIKDGTVILKVDSQERGIGNNILEVKQNENEPGHR